MIWKTREVKIFLFETSLRSLQSIFIFIIRLKNYFKFTNFHGQKLWRIWRILPESAKVHPAKNSGIIDPRKFMSAKYFKLGQPRKLMSVKNRSNLKKI